MPLRLAPQPVAWSRFTACASRGACGERVADPLHRRRVDAELGRGLTHAQAALTGHQDSLLDLRGGLQWLGRTRRGIGLGRCCLVRLLPPASSRPSRRRRSAVARHRRARAIRPTSLPFPRRARCRPMPRACTARRARNSAPIAKSEAARRSDLKSELVISSCEPGRREKPSMTKPARALAFVSDHPASLSSR